MSMKSLWHWVFSFNGRIGRKTFLLKTLFAWFVVLPVSILAGLPIVAFLQYVVGANTLAALVWAIFVLFFTCWALFACRAQRCHDIDMTPAAVFSILNLLLFFKKGTDGPNRFGPDPRDR